MEDSAYCRKMFKDHKILCECSVQYISCLSHRNALHWCPRQKLLPDFGKLPSPTSGSENKFYWPALSFKAVVDKLRFKSAKQQLVDNTQL